MWGRTSSGCAGFQRLARAHKVCKVCTEGTRGGCAHGASEGADAVVKCHACPPDPTPPDTIGSNFIF
jgi:hypothetical protein